ncbi:Predicted ATPase [Lentzea xinjiangensis]|uniref:Predicted ATPase n=1 Tax=Lentzea xinjiangensis TaxID=402600 RepID=A0A1H9MMM1_9PSEU|nr:LuxR C-terminal-related transcriptional regulator [Lentzea xinjiangensis]SER24964.1 Predicted ATPase [Lentzea xinjiangensis]
MTSTGRCALCAGALPPATSGQRRSYCSNACRQRAYRRRTTVSATTAARQHPRVLSNLPAARDTFVGRQQELTKLDQLLRRHRLVTLVGSAGAGKTRLALEAAGRLRRGRTDRVLLVELGELGPHDVLPAVAGALGVTAQPDEPLRDTVIETLVNMRVVVVLDNCEHLLDTCAELVDLLLNRCPGVRVLATSREALWITGEVSFPVEGLPVPPTDRDLVATAAPRSEAVRLFVDRAREREPGFRLTAGNTAAVALLCARLEGMPFAIELAARWVRLLPVADICDRVDEPLELLTLGCRKSPARQRSLREAIEWSYRLLEPAEQSALRRLSVFDGDFDLVAATEVCSSRQSAEPVLDVLSRLQAKSLLTAVPGTTRFRQLEPVRLLAREKLLAADERDIAHEALARWFTDLSDALITAPLSVSAEVQHRLDDHADSLLGTVEWAADRADERLLLLTSALADCTARRGKLGLARAMLRDALRRPSTRDDYRCVALNHAARLAAEQGDHGEAAELSGEAARLARDIGQPALAMSCHSTLAAVQQSSGEWEASAKNNTECLRVAELLGEPLARATCLVDLARTALSMGKPERAERNVLKALPLSRASGAPARIASALNTRGAVALVQDDPDEAMHAFQEALRMDGFNPLTAPDALEGLAVVASMRGRAERALRLEATGRAMRRSVGVVPNPFWAEKVAGAMRTARRILPAARAEAASTPLTAAETEALIQDEVWLDRTAADDSLDDHERRLIALLTSGLTNKQIAYRLAVSVRTVASRLQRLRDKLGLRSREDVAAWGAERAIG